LRGQDRLLQLEQKDQENEMMKLYLNKLCEEEAENVARKRQEQAALRDELKTCNAEILRRKEVAKEQEKLIDQRVIQFQEEKAVRIGENCVNFSFSIYDCWRERKSRRYSGETSSEFRAGDANANCPATDCREMPLRIGQNSPFQANNSIFFWEPLPRLFLRREGYRSRQPTPRPNQDFCIRPCSLPQNCSQVYSTVCCIDVKKRFLRFLFLLLFYVFNVFLFSVRFLK